MKTSLKVLTLLFVLIISTSCKDDDDTQPQEEARFEKMLTGSESMETLKDNVANLEWVNDVRGCFAGIVEPGSQCADLMFAENSDWRTPTPDELSTLITEIDARNMKLNYINTSCAMMSTSMPVWVFTENSSSPGQTTTAMPGNAGLRCVRNN